VKLIALAAAAAVSAPVSPVDRITSAAYRDYEVQLTDKFAATTVRPAPGEPFRLAIPLGNGDLVGARIGSAYYSYADGALTLSLSSEETKGDRLPMLLRKPKLLAASSYRGQNGFGAAANVRTERLLYQGVALIEGPAGVPTSRYAGITYVAPHDYWHRITLDGPEAKALALDTDIVVEGKLANLPGGKAAACQTRISDPTISHPLEVFFTLCYAGAVVDRVAYVRRSTGAVLKEWKR
jgi:hypothetical protein